MQKKSIREAGLVGTLFEYEHAKPQPGILLVPGSDGGIPEAFAEQLAHQGYTVFALGYFALDGLPAYLENIPLEYFEQAFLWFKKQKSVKENHIALIGYSRGGELALLLGSIFPKLMNAIVVYVPSSVVCGGFPHPNKPAWILNNTPIKPFLSGLISDDLELTEAEDLFQASKNGKTSFHANTAEDPYDISELFFARNQQNQLLKKAAIPVENIKCRLLIISGEDDKIWPSAFYGNQIMERLNQKNSPIERKHVCYPNAGHGLAAPYEGSIYHPVGEFWCRLGGTAEGNAYACKASWQEILNFLLTSFNQC